MLAALVVSAYSGVVPYSVWPTAYAGSYAHHVAVAPVAHAWSAPVVQPITQYSSVDVHPVAYHAPAVVAPVPVTYHAPAVAVIPQPATYTAVTKGAVHQAPLDGHAVSQTSLNLAPAPGTY